MMKLRLKSNLDENKEKKLSSIMTAAIHKAAIKCKTSVSPLLYRYHRTSVDYKRSDIEHRIQKIYRKALRDVCPRKKLEHSVKWLTRFVLCGIYPDCADFGHSIVLYCQILTIEALSALKQMIDFDELDELFSEMFSLFADATIVVNVSVSVEEYKLLTSSAGKSTCFDIEVIIRTVSPF